MHLPCLVCRWRAGRVGHGVAGDARVAAEAPGDMSGARPDWGFGRVFVSEIYHIWYAAGGGGVRRRRIFTKNKIRSWILGARTS